MPPKAHPPRHADPAAGARVQQPPPQNDPDYSDEEEEFDLVEVMTQMAPGERRRVYALQGLLKDFHAARAKQQVALAAIQRENHQKLKVLFEQRRAIVAGTRDVTAEEIAALPAASTSSAAEDESAVDAKKKKEVKVVAPGDASAKAALEAAAASATGGIPNFWLTAMANNEVLDGMITERDRAALAHLQDIACEYVDDNPNAGVIITFTFSPNEFFSDATLSKTYKMEFNEDDGDYEIADVLGCDVHWTDAKHNLTVVVKEKKQRNKKNNQFRVVQREEKCESFFNFFSPPKPPASDDDDDAAKDGDDDDAAEFYDQEMEMDMEAGQALMEDVVPKAAYYYTGKSVEEVAEMIAQRFGIDAGSEDEEDEEDEDDDDGEDAANAGANFRAMLNQRGGGGGGAGGRGAGGRGGAGRGQQRGGQQRGGGAAAPSQQQECKQQ